MIKPCFTPLLPRCCCRIFFMLLLSIAFTKTSTTTATSTNLNTKSGLNHHHQRTLKLKHHPTAFLVEPSPQREHNTLELLPSLLSTSTSTSSSPSSSISSSTPSSHHYHLHHRHNHHQKHRNLRITNSQSSSIRSSPSHTLKKLKGAGTDSNIRRRKRVSNEERRLTASDCLTSTTRQSWTLPVHVVGADNNSKNNTTTKNDNTTTTGKPLIVVSRLQGGQWRCEYTVTVDVPDHGHVIQLNLTTFQKTPAADMRDTSGENKKALQRKEKRNKTSTFTTNIHQDTSKTTTTSTTSPVNKHIIIVDKKNILNPAIPIHSSDSSQDNNNNNNNNNNESSASNFPGSNEDISEGGNVHSSSSQTSLSEDQTATSTDSSAFLPSSQKIADSLLKNSNNHSTTVPITRQTVDKSRKHKFKKIKNTNSKEPRVRGEDNRNNSDYINTERGQTIENGRKDARPPLAKSRRGNSLPLCRDNKLIIKEAAEGHATNNSSNNNTSKGNRHHHHHQQPQLVCLQSIGSGSNPASTEWSPQEEEEDPVRISLVYHYASSIQVTLVWDPNSFSSPLSLGYRMIPVEDISCSHWCGETKNSLCLVEHQLCDGHQDCTDGSDERFDKCPLASADQEQSTASDTNSKDGIPMVVIAVTVSACVIGLIIATALMIHLKCRSNQRQQRDTLLQQQQHTHSLSAEMYQSPSSSMQVSSGSGHDQLDQLASLLQDQHHQQQQQHGYQQHEHQCLSSEAVPGTHNPLLAPANNNQSFSSSSASSRHYHQQQQHYSLSTSCLENEEASSYSIQFSSSLPERTHHGQQIVHQYHHHHQHQQQQCSSSSKSNYTTPISNNSNTNRRLDKEPLRQSYPHHISRSRDGEEGYLESQRSLRANSHSLLIEQQVFRPPPNKTVHDRSSPPPPYSPKPPGGTKSLDSVIPVNAGANDARNVHSAAAGKSCDKRNNSSHRTSSNDTSSKSGATKRPQPPAASAMPTQQPYQSHNYHHRHPHSNSIQHVRRSGQVFGHSPSSPSSSFSSSSSSSSSSSKPANDSQGVVPTSANVNFNSAVMPSLGVTAAMTTTMMAGSGAPPDYHQVALAFPPNIPSSSSAVCGVAGCAGISGANGVVSSCAIGRGVSGPLEATIDNSSTPLSSSFGSPHHQPHHHYAPTAISPISVSAKTNVSVTGACPVNTRVPEEGDQAMPPTQHQQRQDTFLHFAAAGMPVTSIAAIPPFSLPAPPCNSVLLANRGGGGGVPNNYNTVNQQESSSSSSSLSSSSQYRNIVSSPPPYNPVQSSSSSSYPPPHNDTPPSMPICTSSHLTNSTTIAVNTHHKQLQQQQANPPSIHQHSNPQPAFSGASSSSSSSSSPPSSHSATPPIDSNSENNNLFVFTRNSPSVCPSADICVQATAHPSISPPPPPSSIPSSSFITPSNQSPLKIDSHRHNTKPKIDPASSPSRIISSNNNLCTSTAPAILSPLSERGDSDINMTVYSKQRNNNNNTNNNNRNLTDKQLDSSTHSEEQQQFSAKNTNWTTTTTSANLENPTIAVSDPGLPNQAPNSASSLPLLSDTLMGCPPSQLQQQLHHQSHPPHPHQYHPYHNSQQQCSFPHHQHHHPSPSSSTFFTAQAASGNVDAAISKMSLSSLPSPSSAFSSSPLSSTDPSPTSPFSPPPPASPSPSTQSPLLTNKNKRVENNSISPPFSSINSNRFVNKETKEKKENDTENLNVNVFHHPHPHRDNNHHRHHPSIDNNNIHHQHCQDVDGRKKHANNECRVIASSQIIRDKNTDGSSKSKTEYHHHHNPLDSNGNAATTTTTTSITAAYVLESEVFVNERLAKGVSGVTLDSTGSNNNSNIHTHQPPPHLAPLATTTTPSLVVVGLGSDPAAAAVGALVASSSSPSSTMAPDNDKTDNIVDDNGDENNVKLNDGDDLVAMCASSDYNTNDVNVISTPSSS